MKLIRLAMAATLFLCLLLLASCGGDAGGTTGSQTTDATTAQTTAAASPALLSATGFTFDGATLTLTVPNATATFSFADRFTVSEGANWSVKA